LRAFPILLLSVVLPAVASAEEPEGQDFIQEARLLYRVVACAGDAPLEGLDEKAVQTHCHLLAPAIDSYRQKYADEAKAFISKEIRPPNLPVRVVYPFGGGDLISAITTYPDAREYTTLSLEHAGDPRRIRGLSKARLVTSLDLIRKTITGLLLHDDSKTENLMKGQRGDIPGQLAFFLVALAVHGYEPSSLRYFRVEPDGSLHYLSADDIALLEKKNAALLKSGWVSPDFSEAFSNAELVFNRVGQFHEGGRTHRHIAQNLGDEALKKDPGILLHLEKKGGVAAMTKAASYLLWRDDFSLIRGYLLGHAAAMISDSTGIPPAFAKKAGFVDETWGHFEGSFLPASDPINKDMRELWKSHPERKLPFRYGYIDSSKHSHLLLMRHAEDKEQ
jgi:hypothetical protein